MTAAVPRQMRGLVVDGRGMPATMRPLDEATIGEGDVTIAVGWSSLNYKDALALTGAAPVVRRFPMIVGIDLAGVVVDSADPAIRPGDEVAIAGCGLGDEHPGGYATIARVPAAWCARLPEGVSPVDAMTLGTAGITAMAAIHAFERNGIVPDHRAEGVLVTGASGGVGTIATHLLAARGYRVVAATGRQEHAGLLRSIGAAEVIGRDGVSVSEPGPLGRERFAAAIDVVGGAMLADVLRQTARDGVVAVCGLVGGSDLPTTVYPLILRGITVAGIDSTHLAADRRARAWQAAFDVADPDVLARIRKVAPLSSAPVLANDVLAGRTTGRIVLDVTS